LQKGHCNGYKNVMKYFLHHIWHCW